MSDLFFIVFSLSKSSKCLCIEFVVQKFPQLQVLDLRMMNVANGNDFNSVERFL